MEEAYVSVLEVWANELPVTLASNSGQKIRAIKAALELVKKHAKLAEKIDLLPRSAQLKLSELNESTEQSEDEDDTEDDDPPATPTDTTIAVNPPAGVPGGGEIRAKPRKTRNVYLTEIWWSGQLSHLLKIILKWPGRRATALNGAFNRTAMLDLMAELAKPGKHEDYDYTVLHRLQTELGSCVARLIWFDKQNALTRQKDYDLVTAVNDKDVSERFDRLTVKTRPVKWQGSIPQHFENPDDKEANGIDVSLMLQNHAGCYYIPVQANNTSIDEAVLYTTARKETIEVWPFNLTKRLQIHIRAPLLEPVNLNHKLKAVPLRTGYKYDYPDGTFHRKRRRGK